MKYFSHCLSSLFSNKKAFSVLKTRGIFPFYDTAREMLFLNYQQDFLKLLESEKASMLSASHTYTLSSTENMFSTERELLNELHDLMKNDVVP